ncbi:MAG: DUF2905 domain-containing protein [Deltaproteobacteria bacterium]|nr:DUF2905 domain-containing protein [Deltaproteobacteria bacterium]
MEQLAKGLITIGIILIALGGLFLLLPQIPFLGSHLGKLPGDIYIKKENVTFYFPVTTSLIISIVISFILFLLKK